MNATAHRLVFNPASNCLGIMAETARSVGKFEHRTGAGLHRNSTSNRPLPPVFSNKFAISSVVSIGCSKTTGGVEGSATLLASAGRDANLIAAAIQNQGSGDTILAAGNSLNLGTLATASANSVVWNATNRRSDASAADVGTSVQAQDDLRLQAGGDLSARAASVQAQGDLLASAGRDIHLSAGQSVVQLDEAHQHKSKGFLSKTITTTRDTLDQTTAQATLLGGRTVLLQAGQDIAVQGSSVIGDGVAGAGGAGSDGATTTLLAGRDVNISAQETQTQSSQFSQTRKSGLMSSGLSVTLGQQNLSTDQTRTTSGAAGATVGAIAGDVRIEAGRNYRQSGSELATPAGSIEVAAQDIGITEARTREQTGSEQKFKQSGLTVAISAPVVSAIQGIARTAQALSHTSDTRTQALGAATLAMQGGQALGALQNATNPAQAASVGISISVGASQSSSTRQTTQNGAQGSSLSAAGSVNLSASGNNNDNGDHNSGNLLIQGSSVRAGEQVNLVAHNRIELHAATQGAQESSQQSSKSGSVGVGISLGAQTGMGVTVAASVGKGAGAGEDVTYANTHIEAGQGVRLQSGGDITLAGAVVQGPQVSASVGGDLRIQSLQDTSSYTERSKSTGGSVTFGPAAGASLSLSNTRIDSQLASVTEQSAMRAGDGGFNVNVLGTTDLVGGAITSSEAAVQEGRNTLTTATLTTRDLQNQAQASAKSGGINLSSDMLEQGKYGLAKAVVGNVLSSASESGRSSGQTRAAVSAGSVTITDEAKQQQLTGKTGQETVANLNRDTERAHTAAQKQDVQALKREVEAERAIKIEAVQQLTTLTDEAYRVMFKTTPQFYKVVCPSGANCTTNPELAQVIPVQGSPAEVQAELAAADKGAVLAVNGIDNPLDRAAQLAMQNAEPVTVDANGQPLAKPEKPSTIYLMHYIPANNAISELLVAAYEKSLAPTLGYTNQDQAYAGAIQARGNEETVSLGHSRGTIVQTNANNILADQGFTNPNLAVRGVGGAVGVHEFTDAAAKVTGADGKKNITFNYFSTDPVSVVAGGNPGVLSLSEFWQVLQTSNSAHSCYGTGAAGCRQVEILTTNSPQGATQDNSQLIQFRGGQQVDRAKSIIKCNTQPVRYRDGKALRTTHS